MNPLPDGRRQCGICGYPAGGDNDAAYLAAHTLLSERYLVGRLLQYTGDAAVYLGYDIVLKAVIRIREYFPNTLSEREKNGALRVISGCEAAYNDYLEKFRAHARALARLRELSNIEAVYDIFDAGNTAYTIAEYSEGNSLETRLGQTGGRLRWEEARPLFMPLLATVASLHAAGVFHLGICPQNLILGTDGKLHLQGFCMPASRQVGNDLAPDLLPGYSAPEQYAFGEEVGAATDVYGLAATIFRTLTGTPLPDGSRRAKDSNDLFVPAEVAAALPDYVAKGLFQALMVKPDQRIRSVQLLRDKLATAPAVSALREEPREKPAEPAATDAGEDPPRKKKMSRGKKAALIVGIAVVALLLFFGMLLILMFGDFGGGKVSEPSTVTTGSRTVTSTTVSPPTDPPDTRYAVSDLMGKNYYDYMDEVISPGRMKVKAVSFEYSSQAPGTIIKQTPEPNQEAPAEQVIQVVVSLGTEDVQVPDYLQGQDLRIVKDLLEALGFRVTVEEIDPVPAVGLQIQKGLVISVEGQGQTKPRGSKITVRISDRDFTSDTEENPDYGYGE